MPRPRATLVLTSLLIAALVGCSKHSSNGPGATLPDGVTLMQSAAVAMGDITSAHLSITTDGDVSSVPIRKAEGDLTKSGDAKGTILLSQYGALIEYEFVLVGDSIYLKGVTGGWQKLPVETAAGIYDPSAILDPDRGIVKLLTTATDPTTEGTDTIDGASTYRVAVTVNRDVAAALVPGLSVGVTGKVWLDQSTKQLRRAKFEIPGANGAKGGSVTIDLTDFNKPVTVSAP
jgi:lipoprotein LprG